MENQKVPLPGNCMDAPVTPVGDGAARAPAAESSTAPRKTRIRWTQDLHERFVECVNQLGGADRTTPRAIQKMMNSDVITIFHIKSHLQKYRMAKYMLGSSSEAKQMEERAASNDMQNLDLKSGVHITEALRVQHVMQRRLGKQLKMQRDLQLRIEAQGKVLQKMIRGRAGTQRSRGRWTMSPR
uniref:Myb family transcription factor APL n=2 Tax=Triticum urartu TaxID=4572 RepID=A0A8R7TTJ2_TRIUA